MTGGLTIMKPVVGQWVAENTLYKERMIPVRIACDRETIGRIMDMTMSYYDQLAVMAYKISDQCIIKERR